MKRHDAVNAPAAVEHGTPVATSQTSDLIQHITAWMILLLIFTLPFALLLFAIQLILPECGTCN